MKANRGSAWAAEKGPPAGGGWFGSPPFCFYDLGKGRKFEGERTKQDFKETHGYIPFPA